MARFGVPSELSAMRKQWRKSALLETTSGLPVIQAKSLRNGILGSRVSGSRLPGSEGALGWNRLDDCEFSLIWDDLIESKAPFVQQFAVFLDGALLSTC
jgi:hypothetical protein